MTYEQALNYDQKWNAIQAFNDLERYLLRRDPPAFKAVALGMQALQKQMPKSVLPYMYADGQCPNCKAVFEDSEYFKARYCSSCGQALDWSK